MESNGKKGYKLCLYFRQYFRRFIHSRQGKHAHKCVHEQWEGVGRAEGQGERESQEDCPLSVEPLTLSSVSGC